jgi:hypothetical protein
MPKVVYSDSKGLVQEAGAGFGFVTGTVADKIGLHLYQEEVTLTAGAVNTVAVRLSKSLPENSVIVHAAITVATAADAASSCNVTIHTASNVAVGAASQGTEILGDGASTEIPVGDLSLATSGLSQVNTAGLSVGSNVYVYVNNAGNNSGITNSPTVVVSILYAGKGEPAAI